MLKNIARTLLVLGSLWLISLPAYAVLKVVEGSVEATAVSVFLSKNGKGFVNVRTCSGCAVQKFPITEATVAYENGQPVNLDKLKNPRGKPATVNYDAETGAATKIMWD